MMAEQVSFWSSHAIWLDAMLVSMMCAAVLSYLGVWMVLGRVVYLPLALTQVSSVGVVLAFIIGDVVGIHVHGGHFFSPELMAMVMAGAAAVYFADAGRRSGEVTVVAYLVSASAVLILGIFMRGDLHDVQSILFGNAVLVEPEQIWHVGAAAVSVAIIHTLFRKKMLYSIFDPDSAGASGMGVFRYNFILFLTFAVMIAFSTRAIGALPVFAFCVLPPMAALKTAQSMRSVFILSSVFGVFSAAMGYYISFVMELPTGASMAMVSAFLLGLTFLFRLRRDATPA